MKSKKVIIIGASGHAKVIADIVRSSGDQLVGFLDDDLSKKPIGSTDDWKKYQECMFVVAPVNSHMQPS